jgi:hypothetical protein
VRDVEADDESRNDLEPEAVLELVEDFVRAIRGRLQGRHPLLQEVAGVRSGES